MHANDSEANHNFPVILLKVNWIRWAVICVCEREDCVEERTSGREKESRRKRERERGGS